MVSFYCEGFGRLDNKKRELYNMGDLDFTAERQEI